MRNEKEGKFSDVVWEMKGVLDGFNYLSQVEGLSLCESVGASGIGVKRKRGLKQTGFYFTICQWKTTGMRILRGRVKNDRG